MLNYFSVEEFVPQHIYEEHGDDSLNLMNPKIIRATETLRDLAGVPLSCNTWKWGGNRNWSGFRDETSPYYSPTSQHTLGNAVDLVSSKVSPHELRKLILDKPEYFEDVTFLECGINWVHMDVRHTVKLWVPKRGFITREEFYAEKL